MPAIETHPGAPVAVGPMHVGRRRKPVVAELIGEAETQPDRIGKIERRHRTRGAGLVPDAIGGKGINGVGKAEALPAAEAVGPAAHRGRIDRVERRLHMPVDVGRQSAFEHIAGNPRQKHVVPFVDTRRRQRQLRGTGNGDDRNRREPRARPCAHLAVEDDHGGHDQERIGADMIDRQTDRNDGQQQRGKPAPRQTGCRCRS